jgi:hypothetical protein
MGKKILQDKKELKAFCQNELNSEWWHQGYESFIKWGNRLLMYGVELETIKEMFSNLYSAVADEYGD